jgi:hypothetical protein
MAAKLTRLTHEIAMQLHLVAESRTIRSSRCRRPVRKLLDTFSYTDKLKCPLRSSLINKGKSKVAPVVFLTEHNAIKAY